MNMTFCFVPSFGCRYQSLLSPTGMAVLCIAACTGCGANNGKCDVQGTVTVDGANVEQGAIRFEPLDGLGATAGTTIEGGKYRVPVPAGKKRVIIEAFRYVESKRLDRYPGMDKVKSPVQLLPAKYNTASTLEAEISANNAGLLNFAIDSK
jgi:hypothetical protein